MVPATTDSVSSSGQHSPVGTLTECSIDEAVLGQLNALKPGEDFAAKIVRLYLDTTPSVLKEIESAVLAQDMNWLRTANHRLSSASAAIGAVQLTVRCNELDQMLRAKAIFNLADCARQIAEEYRRVEAALERWCSGKSFSSPG